MSHVAIITQSGKRAQGLVSQSGRVIKNKKKHPLRKPGKKRLRYKQ